MIDISKKKWVVYLLECGDKTFYCGITNNLCNRLKQHRGEKPGGAKYTKSRMPLKLVYFEEKENRSEALKQELSIKKMSKSAKNELIKKFNKC